MHRTYPDQDWDDEQFKTGFYGIDVNKGGSIDFEEFKDILVKPGQGKLIQAFLEPHN